MKQGQGFHPGALGRGNGMLKRGMAPAQKSGRVFLLGVLGVVHQKVRPGKKLLQNAVLFLGHQLALGGHAFVIGRVFWVRAENIVERLGVIGGADRLSSIGKAVAQTEDGMVQVFCRDGDPVAQIELPFLEVEIFNPGSQLCLANRKIPVGQLAAHDLFQGVALETYRAVDADGAARHINGGEEGKAHDVIPVGMGQKDVRGDRALLEIIGHHEIAQLSNAGTGVDDDEPIDFRETQLDTGGIPAIFHGLWSGTGNGAPNPPEFDVYAHDACLATWRKIWAFSISCCTCGCRFERSSHFRPTSASSSLSLDISG